MNLTKEKIIEKVRNQEMESLIQEIEAKPTDEQREIIHLISSTVIACDRNTALPLLNTKERNQLVQLKWRLNANIPYLFQIGDEVTILMERKVKGIVKEFVDKDIHSLRVKPIDSVYKDDMIISERMLLLVQEEIKEKRIVQQA